ncbi:cupin domain-containing protein [Streptomyces sp. NPDC086783]|uniref:cupin domain-containing protein n=1 Tax=Streptomyces sp. NPDC086783 TaxID=3365758 RepID=UPI0037F7A922
MSIVTPNHGESEEQEKPEYMKRKGIFVPPGEGDTRWIVGDTYTLKVGGPETDGALTFVEATVPAGAGAFPHVHGKHQEAFYLISGELEFVNGDDTITAGPGSFYYVPSNTRHGFFNRGLHAAKMIFMFLPGGFEEMLFDGAPRAERGQPAPHMMDNLPTLNPELMERFGIFIPPSDLPSGN